VNKISSGWVEYYEGIVEAKKPDVWQSRGKPLALEGRMAEQNRKSHIQEVWTFQLSGNPQERMGYLLFKPREYEQQNGRLWPLILFLHGAGETGDDPRIVVRTGLPAYLERVNIPFVVVSPQCPQRSSWQLQTDMLRLLLEEVVDSLRVDPTRVYLTGISMGGAGAWIMGSRYPEMFAAMAPICGYGPQYLGFPDRVCALNETPVWVFHGARDEIVPPQSSRILVETLRSCGGSVRFTVYPDLGHDSWTRTYENPELYTWFLMQVRQQVSVE
jgi:predicted peptidase